MAEREIQSTAPPELSVILVVDGQRERGTRALRSLLDQSAIDRMEILLFDLGPENCPSLAASDHPRVRLIQPRPKPQLSAARVQGVRMAKAPAISLMEEHCEMQPGSAEALIAAHRGHWAAVGCGFLNGNPNCGISNKAFRMNYGSYLRPQRSRGRTRLVAGQNSSFKRDVLLRYGDDLELMMNADLVLQWKMMKDGHELFYEPAAKMAHRNENTVRSLCVGVFYWNWCFSNVRAQIFRWSLPRRALWIVLAPLIPAVRLIKMLRWIPRLGFVQFLKFLRDIPFIVAINSCAAAGQVAGLLNKIDFGASAFSHFEMNEPRLLREEELAR